jgi:hypothetical protein
MLRSLLTIAVASSLFASAAGFAPSFVPSLRANNAQTSFVSRSLLPTSVSDRRRTCLAVNMNIGERFFRLVKANVNEMLNKAEDPEKMLTTIVEDMQVRNFASSSTRIQALMRSACGMYGGVSDSHECYVVTQAQNIS